MRIYNYDANGYYTGSNYEFGGKILPKFTTKIVPPKAPSGTRAKFDTTTETWELEFIPNFSKEESASSTTITEIPEKEKIVETVIVEETTNDIIDNSNHIEEISKLNKEITSLKKELEMTKEELRLAKDKIKNFTKKLSFKF